MKADIDKQVQQVILEFRRLKGMTRLSMEEIFGDRIDSRLEAQKGKLSNALFELQDAYCAEHGWATTHPMCHTPHGKAIHNHDPDFGDPNPDEGFC